MDGLCIGKTFDTFNELESFIKDIEEKHFIQLYKKNSQTVGSALKRTQNRKIKKEHVRLLYSCIHGGRKFSTTSTGQGPNTRFYFLLEYLTK